MNKIITLLTAIFLGLSVSGFAQLKNGSISGSVSDPSSKTLEAASVSLLKAKDSSVVKMSASDKKGKFVFEQVAEGKYLVSVSAIGYQNKFSRIIEINAANLSVDIKSIVLETQTRSLSAVTITSKKPCTSRSLVRC